MALTISFFCPNDLVVPDNNWYLSISIPPPLAPTFKSSIVHKQAEFNVAFKVANNVLYTALPGIKLRSNVILRAFLTISSKLASISSPFGPNTLVV